MSLPTLKTTETLHDSSPREQAAEVLRRLGIAEVEIQQLRKDRQQLEEKLKRAEDGNRAAREFQRATLNLTEDADRARREALRINAQLQEHIAERLRAEQALVDAQLQLTTALENFQKLNVEFETRVRERTEELQEREFKLGELAAELKRIEQHERQRLARLLHDRIQQLLIAASMRTDLLAAELTGKHLQSLEAITAILGDAIESTRNLSVQLVPPLLHDEGLPAALQWLASRMQDQHGITVDLEIEDDADPQRAEDRDILFHAAQEFLLNAAKHARVKQMELKLTRLPEHVCLKVLDDGPGFDPARAERNRGSFGLLQLRQRLTSAGGRLQIDAAIGRGTQASAILPNARTNGHATEINRHPTIPPCS